VETANDLTLVNTTLADSIGGGDCRNNRGTIVADINSTETAGIIQIPRGS
jgi:hypothetical protein